MYDILIKNACIADGTGNPMYHADVAVQGGKIVRIRPNLRAEATQVIDGTGKVLAPGFIDAHSHLDTGIEAAHRCRHMLAQGVTTVIGGMCGDSPVPFTEEHFSDCLRSIGGTYSEESLRCRYSLTDYRRHLKNLPLGVNFTFLIGHGLLRAAVLGYENRKATPEELTEMQRLLRRCMEEGAMGLSFGLRYPPGSYADTDELIALAQVVAEYGGVITAHVRGEADTLIEATHELLQVVRATGVRYVHSHHKAMGGPMNWNKTASTISMMEQAMNEGFDIFCDQYPYIASSNGLKSNIPAELHALGLPKMIELVTDPAQRAELKPAVLQGKTSHERMKYIMVGDSTSHPEYNGRMLNEIADAMGIDPFDLLCDVLRDDKMTSTGIYFSMSEDDIERVMQWDRSMFGSDGGYGQKPTDHPRTFGTFPRVLGRYVREKKIITLENAIRKMTGLPAMVYNLPTKGLIREGMDADLVLFDPETVADLGDFAQPTRGNTGFACVLVNGRIALENDCVTDTLAGKLFFREAD